MIYDVLEKTSLNIYENKPNDMLTILGSIQNQIIHLLIRDTDIDFRDIDQKLDDVFMALARGNYQRTSFVVVNGVHVLALHE